MRLLLTCNPGTEDIVEAEAKEEILGLRRVERRDGRGRVIVDVDDSMDPTIVYASAYRMRSIHSIVLLLGESRVSKSRSGLDEVYKATVEYGLDEYIARDSVFAVSAERIGDGHEYTSVDIARMVGQGVIDSARTRGWTPGVRLNSPSVVVYAEVDEDIFRVGILLSSSRSLHRRGYRIYDHPAALKPTLAYVMLRLSEARDGDSILDPMCGGGTIAIEASLLFETSEVICLDKSPVHIKGAIMNALASRTYNRIRFIIGDARRLEDYLEPDSINVAVSNPPYGIRMGDPSGVRSLYRSFIPSLYRVLTPGGRASLITTESRYVMDVSRRAGFRVSSLKRVRHGDLWATIILLKKPF